MIINRLKVGSLLSDCDGKFISITFIKKDGSVRRLTGRFGVRSHLRGGVNKVVNDANSYLTIFDTHKMAYRTVNLDTIQTVRAKGVEYWVL